jgi:hypothetical protein
VESNEASNYAHIFSLADQKFQRQTMMTEFQPEIQFSNELA